MQVELQLHLLSSQCVSSRIKLHPEPAASNSAEPAWQDGAYVVSESEPRVVMYPNFLSSAEADYLRDLSRWGSLEAAAAAGVTVPPAQALSWDNNHPAKPARSGRTVSIHLPSPCDDATVQAIEERCAAATGIPIHADEEPLGVRHTTTSTAAECDERYCTALHVDTNQGGKFRCATVLLYLHAIDAKVGGETRFPLVNVAKASPLREAAERLADLGVTAFSPHEDIDWPPIACRAALAAAAESNCCGLHVRPKKGLACVFWTHTSDGLDPYSWHAGARLPPEATEGKLIVQKFKSLPKEWRPLRKGDAVRMPVELPPPRIRRRGRREECRQQ